jgi:hypothetical protein
VTRRSFEGVGTWGSGVGYRQRPEPAAAETLLRRRRLQSGSQDAWALEFLPFPHGPARPLSMPNLVMHAAELRERGVERQVIDQGIDTSTMEGRAMVGMRSVPADPHEDVSPRISQRRPPGNVWPTPGGGLR